MFTVDDFREVRPGSAYGDVGVGDSRGKRLLKLRYRRNGRKYGVIVLDTEENHEQARAIATATGYTIEGMIREVPAEEPERTPAELETFLAGGWRAQSEDWFRVGA